jgi:hypothetical protein
MATTYSPIPTTFTVQYVITNLSGGHRETGTIGTFATETEAQQFCDRVSAKVWAMVGDRENPDNGVPVEAAVYVIPTPKAEDALWELAEALAYHSAPMAGQPADPPDPGTVGNALYDRAMAR